MLIGLQLPWLSFCKNILIKSIPLASQTKMIPGSKSLLLWKLLEPFGTYFVDWKQNVVCLTKQHKKHTVWEEFRQ